MIAAQGDLELGWAALREAMGSTEFKASQLKPIEPHTFPQGLLEEEVAIAHKTRPDLNQEVRVDAGNRFTRCEDLQSVVVGVVRGHPVYSRDVADKIVEGTAEPSDYAVYGTTNAGTSSQQAARQYSAVTITVAKRKGTNATDIYNAVLQRVHEMQGVAIPND